MALALAGFGALGVTAAVLAEMLDRSVRSLQQVRRIPGLAPSAMIPRLPRRVARNIVGHLDATGDGAFQQAIRALAVAIEQSNEGAAPRCILTTSPGPHQGKSLVSAALALTFAQTRGRRVLLVDSDLRSGPGQRVKSGLRP